MHLLYKFFFMIVLFLKINGTVHAKMIPLDLEQKLSAAEWIRIKTIVPKGEGAGWAYPTDEYYFFTCNKREDVTDFLIDQIGNTRYHRGHNTFHNAALTILLRKYWPDAPDTWPLIYDLRDEIKNSQLMSRKQQISYFKDRLKVDNLKQMWKSYLAYKKKYLGDCSDISACERVVRETMYEGSCEK